MFDGAINVLKPPAMSSHDVVNVIRRILQQRRVGHAGTLDPFAAGVLPIFIGRTTRLSEYMLGQDKRYLAEIRLGLNTDTHDITGQVQGEMDASIVQRAEVEQALQALKDRGEQVPPRYSALHLNGQRAYRMARKGEDFAFPARPVVIHDLSLLEYQEGPSPMVRIEVSCGKGTYIRALARDLGELLGCGAVLTHLLRTACGHFVLELAFTLEEVASDPAGALMSPAAAVAHLPTLQVSWLQRERIINGIAPQIELAIKGGPVRMIDPSDQLVAIGEYAQGRLTLSKVLA